MKIVVTSDWHLDHVTHGVRRFPELQETLSKVCDAAVEEGAAAFLFLGDLCDPDTGSSVFRCIEAAIGVAQYLAARKIQTVWLAGNHDVIEDGTGDTTLSPLRTVDLGHEVPGERWVQVVEQPAVITLGMYRDDCRSLLCLPFTATSHPYDVESFVKAAQTMEKSRTIAIGHLTVPGVVPGEETTEMPRGREVTLPVAECAKKAKLVLNGHYHRQQRTEDGVWIPGSLARLTFGEEGNRPGYLVLEV